MKRLLSFFAFLSIILACIGADEDSHGIFQAIRENDKAKVKEQTGTAQLKAVEGERRFTPLMTAFAEGRSEIFKMLVEKGANLMQVDSKGLTVFDYASLFSPQGQEAMQQEVKELKKLGFSDETIRRLHGHAELPAALKDRTAELEEMRKYLASVKAERLAALFKAIESGDLEAIRQLAASVPLNEAGANGRTPLMVAALRIDEDAVKILLENNASAGLGDRMGFTVCYQLEIVRAVLRGRQNELNAEELAWLKANRTAFDNTPSEERARKTKSIQCLIEEHSHRITKYLAGESIKASVAEARRLARGADLNLDPMDNELPLVKAITYTVNLEIVKALLDEGARVDAKGNDGSTPLDALERSCTLLEKVMNDSRQKHRKNGMTDEEINKSIAAGEKKTKALAIWQKRRSNFEEIRKYLKYRMK